MAQALHAPQGVGDHARVVSRLLLAVPWTIFCYLAWAMTAVFTFGRPSARVSRNSLVQRIWASGLLRLFGVRLRVRGAPPARPFFLVANHLSYLDILVLGSRLGAVFVSKHELSRWPLLGHLARVTGTIFVDRSRRRDALRVLEEIDARIAYGAGVVLFPEGTSSRGDRIYPLRPALLDWAARQEFPVHVATLRYTTTDPRRPADETVCWWGEDTPFGPHLMGLLALPRIEAHVHFVPSPVRGQDRSSLASGVHRVLTEAFVPSTPEPRSSPVHAGF